MESVVVDAEPAAEGDGAGAAETATDAVMDSGHSSDEDSLPPTPVEATPATEGTTEENRGEEGADGGEAEAETAVKNDAAGAEADTEADADADTDGVASPTDATDPQVRSSLHIMFLSPSTILFPKEVDITSFLDVRALFANGSDRSRNLLTGGRKA